MKLVPILIGCIASASAAAAGTPFEFSPYSTRAIGSWPEGVAIGDVNGDQLEDVVVATSFYFDDDRDYSVFVYLQRSNGALAEPLQMKYGTAASRVDVKLADFNRDGAKDIVVGQGLGISIFASNGRGGFSKRDFPNDSGNACESIALLDIDMNGRMDAICQSWSSGAVLYYGDGLGGIAKTKRFETGAQGYDDIKVGDVTGDDRPDLVITSQQAGHFFVHPNDGKGGFLPEIAYANPGGSGGNPSAVAIGDFDGDGLEDVATAAGGNQPDSAVYLYRQKPDGTLSPAPTRFASYDIPGAMIATDLDKDGRSDLLVAHDGWFALGRYMQSATGLTAEALTQAPSNGNVHSLAVGDINDDGCTDAATADYNRGLSTLIGRNCQRAKARGDFNGDGFSDLLWRNTASGSSEYWPSADSTSKQSLTTVTNPQWSIAGHGDFDGDGNSDVLWHNDATGAGVIWRSGDSSLQQNVMRVTNPAWKIVGTGDFDADGKDDILWRDSTNGRNAIWRSGDYATQLPITTITNLDWAVAGIGDFDGDAHDDIVWRQKMNGQNAIWLSGDYHSQLPVTAVTDTNWTIHGVGDFDGDGRDDLFWRNGVGNNMIWRAANYADRRLVVSLASDWRLAAVGDYDGNGKDDVVWRNAGTGANLVWRSAASSVQRTLSSVAGSSWNVVK